MVTGNTTVPSSVTLRPISFAAYVEMQDIWLAIVPTASAVPIGATTVPALLPADLALLVLAMEMPWTANTR